MFGFGSGAPAPDAGAAPPAPAPTPAPQPQAQPYQPSFLDILQGVIFNGQSPAESAMAARQRNYQIQQNALLMDTLQKATPEQRQAILFNSPEYGKAVAQNFAPIQTAEGASQTMFGGLTQPGGYSAVAPKMMLGPAGQPLALTQNGAISLGSQLAGKKTAANGVVTDENLGLTGQTYSQPQIVAPGAQGVPFTPTVNGGAGSAAAPMVAGAAPETSAPAQAAGPRGIRNSNFGNLKALPNGQQWNGQVGVDPDGYAIFATPEDGVRAAATNLRSYATRHGIDTVAGVVNRWAPAADGNHTENYAHYVAQQMGVDPNQRLNMADPAVQRGILNGIFHFENGPQTMAAWRASGQSGQAASPPTTSAPPAQGGGFGQPFAQGRQPRILSPAEAQAAGFAPGAVVEMKADGTTDVRQAPEYGPEAKSNLRNQILNSEEYKQAQAAMAAYKSMIANAKTMTGPSAYAMLDTFARAINPGAVARPQVIETIEKNLGIPAQLVGRLQSMAGQGNLPPQVRQQIIDAVVPFAQSHWDQANHLNQANTELARAHGFSAADVTAPLDARPQGVSVAALQAGIPLPSERVTGKVYPTPRGPMKWTGSGWVSVGGR